MELTPALPAGQYSEGDPEMVGHKMAGINSVRPRPRPKTFAPRRRRLVHPLKE